MFVPLQEHHAGEWFARNEISKIKTLEQGFDHPVFFLVAERGPRSEAEGQSAATRGY